MLYAKTILYVSSYHDLKYNKREDMILRGSVYAGVMRKKITILWYPCAPAAERFKTIRQDFLAMASLLQLTVLTFRA
jgi:hypothetical protein